VERAAILWQCREMTDDGGWSVVLGFTRIIYLSIYTFPALSGDLAKIAIDPPIKSGAELLGGRCGVFGEA